MGNMRGDLNIVGLADLFQLLAKHQRHGTLTVADGACSKSIYFGQDGLMLLADGARRAPKLGEILLRGKRLSSQQIERVAQVQKQWRTRFGETVVKLGYLQREEMLQAVQEQVEEEIYDVFFWANATFEFAEGPPPSCFQDPDRPVAVLSRDVTGLVLEAMRRLDEWQMISEPLGGAHAVFALTDRAADTYATYQADPLIWTVFALIDGRRTVAQVVADAHIPRFQVYRGLFQLHREGCLKPAAPAPTPRPSPAPTAPPSSRPEAPHAAAAPTDKDTTRLRRAAGAAGTVIVVGSVASFRHELCEDLKRAGYDAVETTDHKVALDMARNQKVHAILLDAPERLENLWGALLHMSAMTTVPIIVLSPSRLREDIMQTIKNGARDYVVKPFARHALVDRLQRLGEESARPRSETMILRRAQQADGEELIG